MAQALHNKVSDNRADRIYADVRGNLTPENHADIFGPELLPGETIVREFRVWVRAKPRPTWKLLLFGLLTCGIYAIYIFACSCCRVFGIGNRRARVAVTSKGRMMVWTADIQGTRGSGICASQGYQAKTDMEWFHVDNINSLQLVVTKTNRCGPFSMCGTWNQARLRMFFGKKYPRNSIINSVGYSDSGAIQPLHKPDWSRPKFLTGGGNDYKPSTTTNGDKHPLFILLATLLAPFLWWYVAAAWAYFGLFTLCTCGYFYTPQSSDIPTTAGGKSEYELDIYSFKSEDDIDGYHLKSYNAWNELVSIARFVGNMKKVGSPLKDLESNPNSFVMGQTASAKQAKKADLISDGKVVVDVHKLPLADDERVIDAIRIRPRMTWFEFFFVPFICCYRKYKTQSTALLTTKRAVCMSEFRPVIPGHYELATNTYFLDKLGGGMVITDPKGSLGYSCDVKTSYGGLRLIPMMSGFWPWTPTVPAAEKKRMYQFMYLVERACKTKQAIPAPAKGSLPNPADVEAVSQSINLWPGEELCSVTRSSNLFNIDAYVDNCCVSTLACNDKVNIKEIVRLFTCGARPWKLDQFLVLTTHRVLSYQHVINSCKISCCQGKARVLMWIPLQDVTAMSLTGTVTSREQGVCERACAMAMPCCNPDTASLTLRMGFENSYHDAPFHIGRLAQRAEGGIIEGRPELKHFRAALAYYQSTKNVNEKADVSPVVTNQAYGRTPFPDYLADEVESANPINSGAEGPGGKPILITVGTTGA